MLLERIRYHRVFYEEQWKLSRRPTSFFVEDWDNGSQGLSITGMTVVESLWPKSRKPKALGRHKKTS